MCISTLYPVPLALFLSLLPYAWGSIVDPSPNAVLSLSVVNGSGLETTSHVVSAVDGPDGVFALPPTETPQDRSAPIMATYYPDWVANSFPPERIDFKRFDWIDFAFGIPNAQCDIAFDDISILRRLVTAAHSSGTPVKLSIGGWTGSKFFSPCVATAESRAIFASNIKNIYSQNNLDGIDIDWEYPGHQGDPGNKVQACDTDNLLIFLKLLRTALPPNAVITVATQTTPFVDHYSQPMKDVSAFASVVDWALLMNYDTWGAAANAGPNAPLYDACGNSTQPEANAVAAVKAWTDAGFPRERLVLGLPSYGYISSSTQKALRTRGLRHREAFVTLSSEDGGCIQFRDIVEQGALTKIEGSQGPTRFTGSRGFSRFWDQCSSTPFLRSASAKQVIPYDDPVSLAMKAQFAYKAGLRGVNMFDVHGDTDDWDLTDAIRAALGKN